METNKWIFIIFFTTAFSKVCNSQDLLVTINNDSLDCKITLVESDTIFFKIRRENKIIATYYPLEKVVDYTIAYFNQSIAKYEAADTTTYYLIETNDGNIYMGQIIFRSKEDILVKTKNIGTISIALPNLKKLEILENGDVNPNDIRWSDYLQSSRYFYGPSGYGLKKGEAYYQNVWILFNQFTIGFTDQFSAGVGLVPLFLFGGAPTPIWLTPKFSLPVVKDKFNLGVGALTGVVLGDYWDNSGFGIVYGIATLGDSKNNISLGLGYGYAGDHFVDRPSVSISGMVKVGKRGYLVTENYIFDEAGLLSLGGRFLIKSVNLDAGFVFPTEVGVFIGIPWLGLVIPIETRMKKN